MAAMGREVILLVQDALHPWATATFRAEVYGRRNELLKQLINCIGWRSDKEKYEALSMIIMYWSHGSQPSGGEGGETASSSVPPEAADHHQSPPGETAEMRQLLDEIRKRLPAGDPFVDMSDGELDEKCHSCEVNWAVEWTYPECESCHYEHS